MKERFRIDEYLDEGECDRSVWCSTGQIQEKEAGY
jgi:hypothetical protein